MVDAISLAGAVGNRILCEDTSLSYIEDANLKNMVFVTLIREYFPSRYSPFFKATHPENQASPKLTKKAN